MESTRRNRGCTQQEVKKCPFPEEMKELSPELSAPKGARALSAGVSQSLSKSPIYIKMPFQTCFDFTFPLSSPSPSRPTSQPHCPRSTRRGPSALPAGKEQERKKRAGNEARSRNRSWSRSSGSCDPFSSCLMLGGRPGGRSWPRGRSWPCPLRGDRDSLPQPPGSGGRRWFQ